MQVPVLAVRQRDHQLAVTYLHFGRNVISPLLRVIWSALN